MDSNNPQQLFVFTKNGQFYRSEDGGESWKSIPLLLPKRATLNAAILDPRNSAILYVGIADQFMQGGSPFEGVYKSVDGGQHWRQLPQTSKWSVLSLAISQDRPMDLAAGTRDGVYRSWDGGNSWRRLSPIGHPDLKNIVSLALDPLDPEVTYAGTPHLPWRTLDNGANWTCIAEGMIDDSDVFSITVDREKVNNIYASACSGIYRSTIRGTRWTKVQGIPGSNRRTYALLQDPVDPNILYAGTTQGLWKSADRGISWEKSNPYPYSINSIIVNPSDHNTLYIATDRNGILKSQDGGRDFRAVNHGFVNRNLTDFLSERSFYTCSSYDGESGGIFISKDQGNTWELTANHDALMGRNLLSMAVSPANPDVIVAGTYDGLLRSRDGGVSWGFIYGSKTGSRWGSNSPLPFKLKSRSKPPRGTDAVPLRNSIRFNDLAFSKVIPNLLYAASSSGLFRSLDEGASFERVPNLGTREISKIVLHPTDPNWLMILSGSDLMISANQGRHWITAAFPASGVQVYAFAFSLRGPGNIWAGTSYGLFLSPDGGRTWIKKRGGLPSVPIHNINVMPQNPDEVFVQSNGSSQVYRSIDGGNSWDCFDSRGLEGITVQVLSISFRGSSLWVLSDNHGIFRYKFQPSIASK